jgi:hypothetical protein
MMILLLLTYCSEVRMEHYHPDPASCQSPKPLTRRYQLLYIYSEYLLTMDNKYARNM